MPTQVPKIDVEYVIISSMSSTSRREDAGSWVRSVHVVMPNGRREHTVVDRSGRSVEEVDVYLHHLRALNFSPNTIRSYASHLALLFRWLDQRGANWEELTFEGLSTFSADLADGTLQSVQRHGQLRSAAPRSRATCEAVLAAIYSFLNYWRLEGRGPLDQRLFGDPASRRASTYSFLAHVAGSRPRSERRIRFRGPKPARPDIIDHEDDFQRLLEAARTQRDKALLSAMYDGGLRIGQALGLHHEDIDIARKRVRIVRRSSNANGALSKQRNEFTVEMPARFMTLYGFSLTDEQLMLDIDSDYVFVNLQERNRGAPMRYSNAIQVITAIGKRAEVDLTPHTLRHTHGTALAQAGWSAPEIAARLGHGSNTSADVYIHLAHDDLAEKYAATDMARREV